MLDLRMRIVLLGSLWAPILVQPYGDRSQEDGADQSSWNRAGERSGESLHNIKISARVKYVQGRIHRDQGFQCCIILLLA